MKSLHVFYYVINLLERAKHWTAFHVAQTIQSIKSEYASPIHRPPLTRAFEGRNIYEADASPRGKESEREEQLHVGNGGFLCGGERQVLCRPRMKGGRKGHGFRIKIIRAHVDKEENTT